MRTQITTTYRPTAIQRSASRALLLGTLDRLTFGQPAEKPLHSDTRDLCTDGAEQRFAFAEPVPAVRPFGVIQMTTTNAVANIWKALTGVGDPPTPELVRLT